MKLVLTVIHKWKLKLDVRNIAMAKAEAEKLIKTIKPVQTIKVKNE